MALTSYPFENQATTEVQYGLLFRQFADTGIVGSVDGPGFAVSTDGSGLDVQVAAGFAIIRGHAVDNNAPVTLTHVAAEANPRIDVIVLRLDPVANAITLEILKGTASATPTAPAITRTDTGVFELVLANVVVPASALNIVSTNITDKRRFSGLQTGVWTSNTRPNSPVVKGKLGLNVTIGAYEWWNGVEWKPLAGEKRTFITTHTWTLTGPVQVAVGDDYYIPPFKVRFADETARLHSIDHRINSGTSASCAVVVDGQVVATFEAKTTWTTTSIDVPLFTGSTVALVVDSLTNSPKNLSASAHIEHRI